MAPSTRLRKNPGRRVDYKTAARPWDRSGNPITPRPAALVAKKNKYGLRRRDRVAKKVAKTKTPPLNSQKPVTQECGICASELGPSGYKQPEDVEVCGHFRDTCKRCVERMIEMKVTDNDLHEAVLACPHPGCEHVLEASTVRHMVSKGTFEIWNSALVKHLLRASDEFMSCLNPKCSQYFCITDCDRNTMKSRNKIECPYCEFQLCLQCSRPYHGKTGCGKHEAAENKMSEDAIKSLGAKPCPNCGVPIEKTAGCDHMKCLKCKHNFCWRCSATYVVDMQHGQDCPHRHESIIQDPGNYFVGDLRLLIGNPPVRR